jgi:membrane-associated phospholipid phosphatase
LSATIKTSCLFPFILFIGLIFPTHCDIAHAQDITSVDSVITHHSISSETNPDKHNYQKQKENFYKTDSIFSLDSPKGYVPSLVYNFKEQFNAPFHFNAKQWMIAGTAFVITGALIHVDNEIDDWARKQKQEHNWVNKSSPFITQFGSNTGIISVGATGLLSAALKNEKGVQTSLLATQAMVTSGVWVRIIKLLSGRERPMAEYRFSHFEGGKWHGPFTQFDQHTPNKKPGSSFDAFPSGHTATAFSIATVFAMQYSDTKVVPVFSYSLASLVGISRLTEHDHWGSDVFVGALLGYVCGKQVVGHYNKTHQCNSNSSSSKSQVTYFLEGNQAGLSFKW